MNSKKQLSACPLHVCLGCIVIRKCANRTMNISECRRPVAMTNGSSSDGIRLPLPSLFVGYGHLTAMISLKHFLFTNPILNHLFPHIQNPPIVVVWLSACLPVWPFGSGPETNMTSAACRFCFYWVPANNPSPYIYRLWFFDAAEIMRKRIHETCL